MVDEEIFRISIDRERAKDLFVMAKERLDMISLLPKDRTYKIIEEYYEIIKELLTAVMYLDGYKTLSYVKLAEYFSSHYPTLDAKEFALVDTLRKFRNGIVYYGKRISQDFMINNENEIKIIIGSLLTLVESKIKSKKE